jgi:hypothetical protein
MRPGPPKRRTPVAGSGTTVHSTVPIRGAHACLAEYQRTALGLPEGTTGVVMAIHIPRLRDYDHEPVFAGN